ncbi:MAG TPA: hypothetical protein VFL97_05190 [Nitrococcus sp.]|nr:hypothetical protein [Nitrococcus sp.]
MDWTIVLQAVAGGLASGLGCWAAIRVELRWLRRDVDELRARVFGAG